MNIIFDIGRVIVKFNPREALVEWGFEKDANTLLELVFKSEEWQMLDRGTISWDEAVRRFAGRAPELKDASKYIMENWCEIMKQDDAVAEAIASLKKAGHRLYYLSNLGDQARRYLFERPVFSLFDGGIVSCDVKLLKPEREIYELLLSRYSLEPETCVFFDDMPQNVNAARAAGIDAVVFTGVDDIYSKVENYGKI